MPLPHQVKDKERQQQKILIRKEGGLIVARQSDRITRTSDLTEISQLLDDVFANDLTSGRSWKETVRVVGDFSQDKTIDIVSNVHLELEGRIRVEDGVAYNNAYSIHGDGQSNFSISGGVWDNNGPNHTGVDGEGFHQMGVRFSNCQDVILEGMTVVDVGRDSFVFTGGTSRVRCLNLTTDTSEDDGYNPLVCSHIEFHNCHAKNHVFDGFHLSVGCENVSVFGGSSTGNADHSLKVLGNKIRIYGLNTDGVCKVDAVAGSAIIEACTFGAKSGTHSINVASSVVDGRIQLIGNIVEGVTTTADRCISINRHRTIVKRNEIKNCTSDFGIFASIADECIISENYVNSALTSANIKMNSGDDCILRDNIAVGGFRGLHILSACNTTKISGNILVGSASNLSDSGTGTLLGGSW